MRKTVIILWALIFSVLSKAQVTFKTIVTSSPLTVGESFQVQYIIDDARMMTSFKEPSFNNFRLISGPNIYNSIGKDINGIKQTRNAIYTLTALRPGHFIIAGATATINGKLLRSNDVEIHVITKEASKRLDKPADVSSDYFLAPGEDPYEKIRKNLFLKLMVDKKSCYVGEPVLATFKLYSRLESKSDIVKNPGFYGFTVYDMLNLSDNEVAIENIYGKSFDVHTIRKVQLYSLQEGSFIIDPIEVKNRIEFSRSAVNKKTEQEIVEGVLASNENESHDQNVSTFETDLSTEPVTIHVKPTPLKNKPPGFNGAIGRFNMSTNVGKDKLAENEQGTFEIKIQGKGNFTQLAAPLVNWPLGIEGAEPEIKDELDKSQSPLSGSRTFRYPFVVAKAGQYIIPRINFSFFNTDSGRYKTITTEPVQIQIDHENKSEQIVSNDIAPGSGFVQRKYWLFALAFVIMCLVAFVLFFKKKKNKRLMINDGLTGSKTPTVNEILSPSYLLKIADDKNFYNSLQQAIWKFFSIHLHFTGSEMSKGYLAIRLKENGIDQNTIDNIRDILQKCEVGTFTGANILNNKNDLLQETKQTLEKIEKFLL